MNILTAIIGAFLLFIGRKLYWLFVAVVGFVAGLYLAGQFLPQTALILRIVIGLVAGIIGVGLTLFLHQFAVGLAGFLGGGLLAIRILELLALGNGEFNWIPFIVGGIIGAVLVVLVFDWALIVLTSLGGAFLVTSAIDIAATWSNLITLVLFVIGIITQANVLKQDKENK